MYGLDSLPVALLDALSQLYDPFPQPDFGIRIVRLLEAAVCADSYSYTHFSAAGAALSWESDPSDLGDFPDSEAIFQLYIPQHPVLEYHRTTANGDSRRISDFLSDRQFRALGLYRDFYRPSGVDYQLAMSVPDGCGGLIGIALNRRSHDFGDADLAVIDLLRPHVQQAHVIHALLAGPAVSNSSAGAAGVHLTGRQREILRLVGEGHSDRTIGRALGISTRTVQAHLQRAYRALDAGSRTEALARLREP